MLIDQLLIEQTPDFIKPWEWPPNSPDLNPVDFCIWGLLQERVYKVRIRNLDHLKERLIDEWSKFSQKTIDKAVNEWRSRLRACIDAEGGHFEHRLP